MGEYDSKNSTSNGNTNVDNNNSNKNNDNNSNSTSNSQPEISYRGGKAAPGRRLECLFKQSATKLRKKK